MQESKRKTNYDGTSLDIIYDLSGFDPIWQVGEFLLIDEISLDTVKNFYAFIKMHNMLKYERQELLHVILNSPGGDLVYAKSIIDLIKSSRIPVAITVSGEACSAGLLIAVSGAKGFREITSGSAIMSHQYSASNSGCHDSLIASAKQYEMYYKLMLEIFKGAAITLTENTIKTKLLNHADTWFSAEEAVDLGLFDRVTYD